MHEKSTAQKGQIRNTVSTVFHCIDLISWCMGVVYLEKQMYPSLGYLSLFADTEPGPHNISPLHLVNSVQLLHFHVIQQESYLQ